MNDPKLNQLLRQHQDIEPRGDFDDCVRRRIRQTEATPAWVGWLDWLRQPAFATVAAMLIGLLVGTIGGLRSASRPTNELAFMAPTTLAGAYLKLEAK